MSLSDLVGGIGRRWYWPMGLGLLGLGVALGMALATPPSYRAEAVVIYDSPSVDSSSLPGGLGSLGSLVSLGGSGGMDARSTAVAVLLSRNLSVRFLRQQGLVPALFPERWDSAGGKWKPAPPGEPTDEDIFLRFDTRVRALKDDRAAGVLRLSMTLGDRKLAAQAANGLLDAADQQLRSGAIADATGRLTLLEKELDKAQATELRVAISNVMESELKKATLARTRERYVFRTIDAAAPPDRENWPKPTLMCIVGAFFGLLTGCCVAYILALRRPA